MIQILIHRVKDRYVAYQDSRRVTSALTEAECIERVRELSEGETVLFYREGKSLPFFSISRKETL